MGHGCRHLQAQPSEKCRALSVLGGEGRVRGPFDVGRWTLDVGRWTLDVGRWTLDVECWMFSSPRQSSLRPRPEIHASPSAHEAQGFIPGHPFLLATLKPPPYQTHHPPRLPKSSPLNVDDTTMATETAAAPGAHARAAASAEKSTSKKQQIRRSRRETLVTPASLWRF